VLLPNDITTIGPTPHAPQLTGFSLVENLLAAVYNTLRNSPCWEDTLLVVTFDENGGIYDHVSPPTPRRRSRQTGGDAERGGLLREQLDAELGIRFLTLGLRIPAC